jgi:raffinose/stachyose/melibiose transport system permease protein
MKKTIDGKEGRTVSVGVKKTLWRWLRNLILLFFVVLNVFALIWVLISSFKTNREILNFAFSLPAQLSVKNYIRVFQEPGMAQSFANSIVCAGLSVAVNAFVCFIGAFALSRYRFVFLRVLTPLLAFGLLVPINSALLPLKIIMDRLMLTNSVWGLSVLYAAIGIPMSVLVLRSHIDGIPRSIDEAAAIDGASPSRIALSIVAPVAKPGLATIMILQAVYAWNEFLFALTMISDQRNKTLQVIIRNFLGVFQANYGALFASVVVAVAPVIILFVIFQKRVIEAFTTGAVK